MHIKEFIDNELKTFSTYDSWRSIPKLTDGLKPSQRKCIHGMISRGENSGEIKVAQAASIISEKTKYHHGEGSLQSTIVGLAQNYAGTNNLNLFEPIGQFGNRLSKESAAPRYIYTQFTKNFRNIFKKEDDLILEHMFDDGDKIEPVSYLPILPMVLINGSSGVGTGFASYILQYLPADIKAVLLAKLQNKKDTIELIPGFQGFTGSVIRNPELKAQVIITGKLEIVNSTTIHITELPVGIQLDSYCNHLLKLEDDGFIKTFDDLSTEEQFKFVVTVPRSTTALSEAELLKKFKLISRETENYTLWSENDKIVEFSSVEEIIDYFIPWRLTKYEERRNALINHHQAELAWFNEKLRFILFYLKNTAGFKNKPKAELLAWLKDEKFSNAEKLLGLSIWHLTHDEIEKLEKQIKDIQVEIDKLAADTAKDMWVRELKELKF